MRPILTQLNHTELRYRLGRRIHHGERGEIRSPLQQRQEEQLGALGLALNAVVHRKRSTRGKPFSRSGRMDFGAEGRWE